jgi:cell division protein FtsB
MLRAESTIKVWGQDAAPRPKAALQAEIDQLKVEKEKLEEELRKIKRERS